MNNAATSSNRGLYWECLRRLRELLPKSWHLKADDEPRSRDGWRPDAVWTFSAPDGGRLRLVIEVKSRVEPRDVPLIRQRVGDAEPLMVLAPYLSERTRLLLSQHEIAFMDSRGNLSLANDSPSLVMLIEEDGDERREPKRHPRTSLRGPITGRTIRFICDHPPPLRIQRIARETRINPGGISRIVDFLDREHYVTRGKDGGIIGVDWESLLERWSRDLAKQRIQQRFFEPRGLSEVYEKLRQLSQQNMYYAISGLWGASFYVVTSPPHEAFVYVRDIPSAAGALDLRSSARVSNIRLVEAYDSAAVKSGVTSRQDVLVAAPTQILADLFDSGVRDAREITAFATWMRDHESDWHKR